MCKSLMFASGFVLSQLLYYYHMHDRVRRSSTATAPAAHERNTGVRGRARAPLHTANVSATGAPALRKLVLYFPYSGEYLMVRRRLAQCPAGLLVMSESVYNHNCLRRQNLSWSAHFAGQRAEYVLQYSNLFETASERGRWAQEVLIRNILGRGVRNLYERREIGDDDIVVDTDADEVMAPEALAWLWTHL